MVKNEADIIAGSIRHMATQVDHLIVADNASTDGTRDILDHLATGLPLTVLDDPDPAYYQSAKMSRLATLAAADHGAVWVVPFDADELWSAASGARMADVLAVLSESIVYTPSYSHRPTTFDETTGDPFTSMVWRNRRPDRIDKIVFRWEAGAIVRQGNHSVHLPSGGAVHREPQRPLVLHHFPNRSVEQFVGKTIQGAAAYRLTDLPQTEGTHWRQNGELYERGGRDALEQRFMNTVWCRWPQRAGLIRDPAPYRGQR